MTFGFYQPDLKKVTLAGLNSLWQNGCLYSTWYFMILPTFFIYSKHQIKVKFFIELLNPRTLKNSVVIFKALDTFTASLTSAASATSMASRTSKALFHQKTSWFWWFHPPWHQNDQNWSLFVDWITKIQIFTDIWQLSIRGCWGQSVLFFWK